MDSKKNKQECDLIIIQKNTGEIYHAVAKYRLKKSTKYVTDSGRLGIRDNDPEQYGQKVRERDNFEIIEYDHELYQELKQISAIIHSKKSKLIEKAITQGEPVDE